MKVVSFTPSKISLWGGGTDLEPYCSKYGGLVINLAINIRQKIILYTSDDIWERNTPNEFPYEADPQFYYHITKHFGLNGQHVFKIKSEFDGNIMSGLGSSGSAAVCLIGAINKLKGLNLSLEQIAQKAYELENSFGIKTGNQDHLAATYGGFNAFYIGEKFSIQSIYNPPFISSLVLFYTGHSRNSSKLQHNFDNLSKEQIDTLNQIKELAGEAELLLRSEDIEKIGKLLDKAWELKKQSNKVSTPEIDRIYKKGMDNGAWGGKLLGAGGGGYMVFSVNPKIRQKFIQNMDMEEIDFSLDNQGLDVRIL